MRKLSRLISFKVAFIIMNLGAINAYAADPNYTGVEWWEPVDPEIGMCTSGPDGSLCNSPSQAHEATMNRYSRNDAIALKPLFNADGTIARYASYHDIGLSQGWLGIDRICETVAGGTDRTTNLCKDPIDQTENGSTCSAVDTPASNGDKANANGSGNTVSNPIDIRTGNKYQVAVDFETSGPDSIVFKRHYNSLDEGKTSLTLTKWRTPYDRKLLIASSGTDIHAWRHNGRAWHFELDTGVWSPVSGQGDAGFTLVANGTNWELTYRNGSVETYDSTGALTSIEKPNGYTQTLTYVSGILSTMVDSYGRQISFTFTNYDGAVDRLSAVTDPEGKVHSYSYDTMGNLVSVNHVDSGTETYHYENSGFRSALTGITDENEQRFATWEYNSDGLATAGEHGNGLERVDIIYNADGTRTVTTSLGRQTIYHITDHANGPRISQIEGVASSNCLASDSTFTYDTNGYRNQVTDAEGKITMLTNDSNGMPTSITEGSGSTEARNTTYTWHSTFNKPTLIERAGYLKVEMTYDAVTGDLLSRTETDLTSHTVPYSTNGEVRVWAYTYTYDAATSTKLEKIEVDGPLAGTADTTTYDYDVTGHLSKITNALSQEVTVTAVDGLGKPISFTDANGIITDLTYNTRGWMSSVIVNPGAAESKIRILYDDVGQVTKMIRPDGSELSYAYDSAHRLTTITNRTGETINYILDAMSNVTAEEIKSSDGAIKKNLSRTFDELGRVMTVVGANLQTTSFDYDRNDLVTKETDPRSNETTNAYDAINRLITVTDANLKDVTMTVDDNDQVTNVGDKRSLNTAYVLNGFGDVIRRTSPDTGVTDYEYDAAGNMTKRTDARAVVTNFTYDDLDRVLTKAFVGSASEDVSYTYDETLGGNYGIGRLTKVTDANGSNDISYDVHGNVIKETRIIGLQSYVTEYEYDTNNNLISMIYPSGRTVTYHRDLLGRVSSMETKKSALTAPVTIASNFTYAPFGPLESILLGNGLKMTLTRDQDYRITRLQVTDGTTDVQDLSYSYGDVSGDAGNITGITDALDTALNQSLTYDAVNRLTNATGIYGTLGYGYDANENRLSRTITNGTTLTETSTIDPSSNKLLSINDGSTTRSFGYTANGNITTDSAGSGLTYNYNHANRMSEVLENSITLASYLYNDFGQRTVKDIGSGDVTHYHYDLSGVLIGKSDDIGTTETEYVSLFGFPLAVIEATGGTGTPVEQIIDNDATEATATGDWASKADGTGYEGLGYASRFGGSGENNFTWTPTLVSSNQYQVYAKWPENIGNGSTATYTVHHAGGSEDVTVDQSTKGGEWKLLGVYPMDPSQSHRVVLSDKAEAADTSEIIIDNTDPAAIATGNWVADTTINQYGNVNVMAFHGTNYVRHASGGVGDNSFKWRLNTHLKQDGRYKVYARWAKYSNRATNAEYTVTHDGGTSSVTVNQQQNGGTWNLLGVYDFSVGSDHVVQVTDIGDTTYVVADSIRLVRDLDWQDGDEIIVDNDQAILTGASWLTFASAGTEALGADYNLLNSSNADQSITWEPTLSRAGRYKVYAKWPRHGSSTKNAYFSVHHADGTTRVLVHQTHQAGNWVSLGSYNMDVSSGHNVELDNAQNTTSQQYLMADAVKFVRDGYIRSEVQSDPVIVVDNLDANTSTEGTWLSRSWTKGGTLWGTTYSRTAGPSTPPATFTWTPTLSETGKYRVYARWSAHSTNSTIVNYTTHHSAGSSTVTVDQEVNGGTWMLLGTYDLAPSSSHRVVMDDTGSNGRSVADAIKFEFVDPVPGDFVVDNLEGTPTGTGWATSTSNNGGYYWSDNFTYVSETDPTATFTWEPVIPEKKLYRLYARWTDDANRATSVKYTVHHGGGTSDVYFNQRYNASSWMPLGEYVMEPGLGHKIVLSHDNLDGLMVADAIAFEVIDDLPAVVADAIKLVSNDGEDLTYVHPDHLGAPQKMTDKDRSVVWDASFLPFGEEDSLIGSAANDNRFPGQRLSSETGLHYNYFRDYDPTTGRYLQSDPIGLAGGINTYGYVSGNPVNYVDPEGTLAQVIVPAIVVGIPICIAINCTKPIGDALNGWYKDLLTHNNENSEEECPYKGKTPDKAPEDYKPGEKPGDQVNTGDGSYWSPDTAGHAGSKWKRWPSKRHWKKKKGRESVRPDGSVR